MAALHELIYLFAARRMDEHPGAGPTVLFAYVPAVQLPPAFFIAPVSICLDEVLNSLTALNFHDVSTWKSLLDKDTA